MVNSNNALLQYCGLRIIESVLSGQVSWKEYNSACWSIRERIAQPAIRFLNIDPINDPPRRVPGTRSVLVLPNNTSLDSHSTLLTQAQSRYDFRVDGSTGEPGSIVRSELKPNDYYDEIRHLVCRKPSDPKLQGLSAGLRLLNPGEHVVMFRIPVFGQEGEWEDWVDGLARWLFLRNDIQNAAAFIDLCFIEQSSHEAACIATSLHGAGIPYMWPADA